MQGRPRPLGVTIIAVLLFLLGLLMILLGFGIFALGEMAELEELGIVAGAVTAVFGIIYLILAIGFFRGWNWVWYLTVFVLVIGIIWNIVQWVLSDSDMGGIVSLLISLILPVIILLYMNSKKVKGFFFQSP